MAKKQQAAPADGATAPDKPAAEAAPEAKKGKDGKAKEPKAKAPKEKTAPAAPAEAAAAPPAPAGTSPEAAAPAAAPASAQGAAGPSTKKKGKRPGVAPPRGKKLRNHLKNQTQRLAKEGPAPLKRA